MNSTSNLPKSKIALVGAGSISTAHAMAFAGLSDQCEIVAVCDPQIASAKAMADKYGAKAFADFESLTSEVMPDAISICTPPNSHVDIVRIAAQNNISILCEKPPARSLEETQTLIDIASTGSGVLVFAFCHRFHNPVVRAKELLDNGVLGKLIQVNCNFGFRFDRIRNGDTWFTDPTVGGGGVVVETLVHNIDLFRFFAGNVKSVKSAMSTTIPGIKLEDSAALLLQSESGAFGLLSGSWVTAPTSGEITLFGTEGVAVVDYDPQADGFAGSLPETHVRYRNKSGGEWARIDFAGPDRFHLQAAHFLELVRSKKQPSFNGAADALAAMAAVEAAYNQ